MGCGTSFSKSTIMMVCMLHGVKKMFACTEVLMLLHLHTIAAELSVATLIELSRCYLWQQQKANVFAAE